jgi:geranylgeranyl pyrophosphate synthase
MADRDTPTTDLPTAMRRAADIVENALQDLLPEVEGAEARLAEAMRYATLNGGKRLRAFLVLETAALFSVAETCAARVAASVEMLHAYSLVHDDLPAMDDDDLRRGMPTCHKAFDEGTAILAGDALQALAFGALTTLGNGLPDATRVRMLSVLAGAIGTRGMAGGQAMDLEAAGRPIDAARIEQMHRLKTGALIRASVELGALAAPGVDEARHTALRRYGEEIGLAFQIQDDILDVTGDTAVLGKRAGADAAHGKPNYPSIFGLEQARQLAREHRDRAIAALAELGEAGGPLRSLAHYVVDRVQ